MAKEAAFFTIFDIDCRKRHFHCRVKGKVARFTVQLEVLFNGRWHEFVRYDTAHGFAHRDIVHFNGREDKTPLHFYNFNEALDFAESDIETNWEIYKERFLKEARHD